MVSKVFMGAVAVLAFAGTTLAQEFNIDTGIANAAPAAGYAAATTQAGFWNSRDATVVGPTALTDITGAATPVGLTISGTNFNFTFNNVGTAPGSGDELLMDDLQDLSGGANTVWTIGPMAAGTYKVTVYSWAPDFPPDSTTVTLTGGANGGMICAGTGNFTGYILGQTHVQDTVTISAGGNIVITAQGTDPVVVGDFGSINGVQIESTVAAPVAYCTGKINSAGCTPSIGSTGAMSATATSGFILSATQELNNKVGLVLYSEFGRDASAFGPGGLLCVKAPTRRSKGFNSGGTPPPTADCSGVFSIDFNAFGRGLLGTPPNPAPYLSLQGQVVTAQFWGRDPGIAVPNNFSLSNGLEFVVGP